MLWVPSLLKPVTAVTYLKLFLESDIGNYLSLHTMPSLELQVFVAEDGAFVAECDLEEASWLRFC